MTIHESNALIAEFMGYTYYSSNHPDHPKYKTENLLNYKDEDSVIKKYDNWSGWKTHPDLVSMMKFNQFNPILKGHIFLCRSHKDLKYNTSWDWLMPVVQKLTSLDFNEHEGLEEYFHYNWPESEMNLSTPIEKVFNEVLNLVIWLKQ